MRGVSGGKCLYTAEEFAFTYRCADRDGGSAGGGLDGAGRGGNSGSGGSGSGRGSSTIVVRREGSSSAVSRAEGLHLPTKIDASATVS